MLRKCLSALFAFSALLLWNAAAQGQFVTLVTDFEDPGWTPFVTEVMFRDPSVSGSTTGLDPADPDLTYLTDIGLDPWSVVHSGTRASAATWGWLNPGYHTSWVRLVTFDADELPNPAVHLGGKVRIWVAATAYTDNTYTVPVNNGNLFLGIGVRETGQGVHQGGDGGVSGDIEWVGLDARLVEILGGEDGFCNTEADPNSDDVQVIPYLDPAGPDDVCVDSGPDNVLQTAAGGDDTVSVTPHGMYSLPTDGTMRFYEFDLPALEASGNVFAFTGDGTLGATPNNRGTLEHLALINDPINGAAGAKVLLVNVDDVEFEAPVLDPPSIRTQPDPPRPLDETVRVEFIKPDASLVEVIRLDNGTLIGSADPGDTEMDVPTTPLPANVSIVARQTVGSDVSDDSTPVVVVPSGNGPLRIAMAVRETDAYDHDLTCGDDGTGYDPDQPSNLEFIGASDQDDGFGIPTAPRFAPQSEWFEIVFNPCDEVYGVAPFSGDGELTLNPPPDYTNGVWEGLYFRIDELNPTTGPFTVYIDDVTVWDDTGVICFVDDFESYEPNEFVVGDFDGNGTADTVAEPTDVQVVPAGSPVFPGQIIVAPGADGTLETAPAGDDLLSAMHARFNYPGVAGTSVGLASEPDLTAVTDEEAFSGTKSLKVQWGFMDASNLQSVLRLTTNGTVDPQPPPETFLNPDPVVPLSLDGTLCDGAGDIYYSVMIKLPPSAIPADCDGDGDVDLLDFSCLQRCFGESPVSPDCATFDIAPNGAPDDAIDVQDFELFLYLFVGPQR